MTKIPIDLRTIDYKPLSGNAMARTLVSIRDIFGPSLLTLDDKDVSQLVYVASNIYQKISLPNINDLHLTTCCWIASKLVLGSIVEIVTKYNRKEIVEMEVIICRHLSYCLIPIAREFVAN